MILASSSPRRKEILSNMGFSFEVVSSDADETFPDTLPAHEIPGMLAIRKAKAVQLQHPDALILAADTVVDSGGKILNTPASREEAISMLSMLSGKKHQVHSGYCILAGNRMFAGVDTTAVWFRQLRQPEMEWYVSHREVMDKAGAYGIQDWIGLIGVTRIEGSYFTVMGLPAHRIWEDLREVGYAER